VPKYDKQHVRKVNQLKADGKLKKRIEHKVPDVNDQNDWDRKAGWLGKVISNAASLGMCNSEIAKLLGMTTNCFNSEIYKNPPLASKLMDGRDDATKCVVAQAFRTALGGYTYTETEVKETPKGTTVTTKTRVAPPNPIMQIFWMVNQDPENWKHTREVVSTKKLEIDSNAKPEGDKISRLFGSLSKDNPNGSEREHRVPDKTARVAVTRCLDAADVPGDVPGETANNVQDDALDVPAQEGTVDKETPAV